MESVASSNELVNFRPPQPLSDRIFRALRHKLLLLHRSNSTFFILGATCNVYTVTLSSTPSCTCPDRTTPCKHILFVLIKVLNVSLNDMCLRRKVLRPCQLNRLLSSSTNPESVAEERIRRRFHQMYGREGRDGRERGPAVEEGSMCPVCLEDIEGGRERVLKCGTCRNGVHEECFKRWRRSSSRGRRGVCCVICRARWRERGDEGNNKYLNLSAYVHDRSEELLHSGDAASTSTTTFCATPS